MSLFYVEVDSKMLLFLPKFNITLRTPNSLSFFVEATLKFIGSRLKER